MPLDFGDSKEDKEKVKEDSKKSLLDEGDLEDVDKIADMLNPDEKVLLVARQSKIKPGGSYFNTKYHLCNRQKNYH